MPPNLFRRIVTTNLIKVGYQCLTIHASPFMPGTNGAVLGEFLMARQNRRDIFDPNEVGAFHAVQRTVRRAWICGLDPVSGKSFEHRRTWIQNRLQELAASFGIDCLSFAVCVDC